jgi:DNA replication ATP-dependent helicase Dna2
MSGLLVVHPDLLLSGTSIVSSLFCMRKAVLNERFKGVEGKRKIL